MAEGRSDSATAVWAREHTAKIEAAFDEAWWAPDRSLYADSRCNADDVVAEEERADTATRFTFSAQFVVGRSSLVQRRVFGCHRWHARDGFTQWMPKPPDFRAISCVASNNVRYEYP